MAKKTEVSKTVQALKNAGIVAKDYDRAPFGSEVFGLGVTTETRVGTIRVWEGNAKPLVFGDRKERQAVVLVNEPARTLEAKIRLAPGGASQDLLARRFNVALPMGTTYKIVKRIDDEVVEVAAKVPASNQTFLVGMDEVRQFISALPSPVHSVKEAHALLRPDGVSRGAQRQGEWFFQPVKDKALIAKLNERVRRQGGMLALASPLELGSNHFAASRVVHDSVSYAIGLIWDQRKDRHDPLVLDGWHRIVRNGEIKVAANTLRWD